VTLPYRFFQGGRGGAPPPRATGGEFGYFPHRAAHDPFTPERSSTTKNNFSTELANFGSASAATTKKKFSNRPRKFQFDIVVDDEEELCRRARESRRLMASSMMK